MTLCRHHAMSEKIDATRGSIDCISYIIHNIKVDSKTSIPSQFRRRTDLVPSPNIFYDETRLVCC